MEVVQKNWFEAWFNTPQYHLLYSNRDYTEADQFITKLVGKLGLNQEHKQLDLACGSGRHSISLAKYSSNVFGYDLAANSIAEAKSKAGHLVKFKVHDMRQPFPDEEFDFVFNLFTSIGYFEDSRDNELVFQNIKASIKPEGKVLIDFFNPEKVIRNLVAEEVIVRGETQFNVRRNVLDGRIIKEITFQDEYGKSKTYHEKVQACRLEEFEEWAKKTSLVLREVYGSYSFEVFDKLNSDRMIMVFECA